jgi:hypothetical protein
MATASPPTGDDDLDPGVSAALAQQVPGHVAGRQTEHATQGEHQVGLVLADTTTAGQCLGGGRWVGPSGRMPVAVVTRSAAVFRRMVKLMRSMSRPGRAVAVSAAVWMSAW